jgi:hypothetical protein
MVLVSHTELKRFTRECLIKSGASASNAEPVAAVLVEADLRGVYSHGTNRLDLYCDELRRGAVNGESFPVIANEAPATAMVRTLPSRSRCILFSVLARSLASAPHTTQPHPHINTDPPLIHTHTHTHTRIRTRTASGGWYERARCSCWQVLYGASHCKGEGVRHRLGCVQQL